MSKNTIWINEGNENNWIKLKLYGDISNSSAIGAKVYVSAIINGERIKQMQTLTSVTGYCSQNSSIVHFGLSDSDIIDTIQVLWPSGIIQVFTNVKPNETLAIYESMVSEISDQQSIIHFNVSPNPAISKIYISAAFSKPVDTMNLQIIAAGGEIVYDASFTNISENWEKSIELSDVKFRPGVYHLKASAARWSITRNLVIVP